MELVAAHDGVARSLLYEHFASIDEIYLECHHTAREEMQERMLRSRRARRPRPARSAPSGTRRVLRLLQRPPATLPSALRARRRGRADSPSTPAELRFMTAEQIAALFIAAAPHVPQIRGHRRRAHHLRCDGAALALVAPQPGPLGHDRGRRRHDRRLDRTADTARRRERLAPADRQRASRRRRAACRTRARRRARGSGIRGARNANASWSSARARFAPRQKCGPGAEGERLGAARAPR